MKGTYQGKASVWKYISDFAQPSFFVNPLGLKSHQYIADSKRHFHFVEKLFSEQQLRDLYQRLFDLFDQSRKKLHAKIEEMAALSSSFCVLKEQEWFIHHLQEKLSLFSIEEYTLIILNAEQREKYAKFLQDYSVVAAFEIFVSNYLIHALTPKILEGIFLQIYSRDKQERTVALIQLFNSINCAQAKALSLHLKKSARSHQDWIEYCKAAVDLMRNSQIKELIPFLPAEIENIALEKLYPCEILEVVDQEIDEKKKRYLIDKVLLHHKKWWGYFSHDEVSKTCKDLKSKIS